MNLDLTFEPHNFILSLIDGETMATFQKLPPISSWIHGSSFKMRNYLVSIQRSGRANLPLIHLQN